MDKTFRIGIVGCGAIFPAYITGSKPYPQIQVVACADMDVDRAKARAKEFGLTRGCSVDELLGSSEIDIVVNLTIPKAHGPINLKALQSGKHAYTEKPFAIVREEGQQVIDEARLRQLYVGCAPDTFFGSGIQTARRVIDEGMIGAPVAATAFVMGHGPEAWHPSPEFFYKQGAGPMLDMGPYYVTALINLIGPIRRVTASTRSSFKQRVIGSQPLAGKMIDVEVPTHYAGVMDFQNGAIGTIITSFDVWAHTLPCIEIHGTEGSVRVPDPNCFDGEVRVRKSSDKDWVEVKPKHTLGLGRGVGVADLARAIDRGRSARASGEMAFHVLDVMNAFSEASNAGQHIDLKTTCARPAPLPVGLKLGELD